MSGQHVRQLKKNLAEGIKKEDKDTIKKSLAELEKAVPLLKRQKEDFEMIAKAQAALDDPIESIAYFSFYSC